MMPEDTDAVAKADAASEVETPLADDGRTLDAEVEAPAPADSADDEVRDELPADLDVSGFVGPHRFPDNSRRRIPGVMYLVIAALCVAAYLAWHDSASGLVNGGFLLAAGILGFAGILSLTSGWRLGLDEKQALVAATKEVGFPVGHASAQLTWRGLRSRPTWRILLYSIENPPGSVGSCRSTPIDGHTSSTSSRTTPSRTGWRTDRADGRARRPLRFLLAPRAPRRWRFPRRRADP